MLQIIMNNYISVFINKQQRIELKKLFLFYKESFNFQVEVRPLIGMIMYLVILKYTQNNI